MHLTGCEGLAGPSYVNQAEAVAVASLVQRMGPAWHHAGLKFGVATPYKAQLDLLSQGSGWYASHKVERARSDGAPLDPLPSRDSRGATEDSPFASTRHPHGKAERPTS